MSSSTAVAGPSSALRPLVLPQVPGISSDITNLQSELDVARSHIEGYHKLESKLASITDEPTWNAIIPFGSLAYFPGHLIHTNDIIVPPPPIVGEPSSSGAVEEGPKLRSAKQAKEDAVQRRELLEKRSKELEAQINEKQEAAKKSRSVFPGLEDGWAVNENGEVLNDEGLPIFDIQEELPPEPESSSKPEVKSPAASTSTAETAPRKGGYLIKKKGKITTGVLHSNSSPTRDARETATSSNFPLSSTTKALLDQLEKEEEEEERAEREKEMAVDDVESVPLENTAQSSPLSTSSLAAPSVLPSISEPSSTLPLTSTSTFTNPIASNSVAKPPITKYLSSFSSGFLKAKPSSKPKILAASPTTTALAGPKLPVKIPPAHLQFDLPTPLNLRHVISDAPKEPLHHVLPPPKSIYRPTPPPSEPNSRPSSPRPDRKVTFDATASDESGSDRKPKKKRAAILLPPPPGSSPLAESSATFDQLAPTEGDVEGDDSPLPASKKQKMKEVFSRPVKDIVVERPVAPVPPSTSTTPGSKPLRQPPMVRSTVRENPAAKTKASPSSSSDPPRASTSSAPPQLPIHTISLSKDPSAETTPGEASIYDISPDDEGLSDEDDEDSDSSGFYGNSDISDEDELDIDSKLHAREVALEYHRQRMGLGAGAGTGPLGLGGAAEKWDSWDQPIVPMEATAQGRVPGTAKASRFRTGRLESAQMIIPSLLASHVVQPGQDAESEGEDDGLSPEERETLRLRLEKLAEGVVDGKEIDGVAVAPRVMKPEDARPSIDQMLGSVQERGETVSDGKQPPVVRAVGRPISVPSNTASGGSSAATSPPPSSSASTSIPPKRVSRFKARQMGLDS